MATVYLNGKFVPKGEAMISVEDRGFVFGDGIYEVVRAIGGRLFEWPAHAERLAYGLRELRIDATGTDALGDVCLQLLRDNALTEGEATLYLQVSRGAAPRTHYFPPAGTANTVYASASRFVPNMEMRNKGVKAITYPDQRWARCDIKTVNLLGPVLARQAAVEQGAYEAILHRDGMVTEGAATTCFAVIDGVLRTTPLSNYLLPSITRAVLMEIIRGAGIRCEERAYTLMDLRKASEIFVCGTTTDVQPVVTLDGQPVGDGAPGPTTVAIRELFAKRLYGR
ncbi:aminotransferase class IV [Pseudogemmatithrix spongiicola]|uniref:Aminotransferase class IV n=1 Tax=Pseudogemmatithrix spongiicola TaxID=3062599 RepID=A0AA49Q454_9BACT|nr:aminotransferase class IV [Gemmatimonadaceae bacterium 'strain 138']WKW14413.1 aminotransferase class IV [Gemmatimonadaceae bacterium 'strain 318']